MGFEPTTNRLKVYCSTIELCSLYNSLSILFTLRNLLVFVKPWGIFKKFSYFLITLKALVSLSKFINIYIRVLLFHNVRSVCVLRRFERFKLWTTGPLITIFLKKCFAAFISLIFIFFFFQIVRVLNFTSFGNNYTMGYLEFHKSFIES